MLYGLQGHPVSTYRQVSLTALSKGTHVLNAARHFVEETDRWRFRS